MCALHWSSFAGAAGDSRISGPVACGDDAGKSAALAIEILELLDVRAGVRNGGCEVVHGRGGVWGPALRGDAGGQPKAFATSDDERNLAQGKCTELADPAPSRRCKIRRLD